MPAIIPIKALKNTAEISEMCHSTDEPIFVTKNGYGDMVIMSMESYENDRKRWRMHTDLEISELQDQLGMTMDARESLAAMREQYGL